MLIKCRRDSFITHRAFCDALAQETARLPHGISAIGAAGSGGSGGHLYGDDAGGGGINLDLVPPPNPQFGHLITATSSLFRPTQSYHAGAGFGHDLNSLIQDTQSNINSWPGSLYNLSFFSNNAATGGAGGAPHLLLPSDQFNNSRSAGSLFPSIGMSNDDASPLLAAGPTEPAAAAPAAQMSATALLQKAAQMGAATQNRRGSLLAGAAYNSDISRAQPMDTDRTFQTLIDSLSGGGVYGNNNANVVDAAAKLHHAAAVTGTPPADNRLTRDFLGVANLNVLESEMKSAFSRRSNP